MLGRKKSLLIDNFVVFGGLIGLTFSNTFVSLLICRFILGVSVASLMVNVPSYVGEICQPEVRMVTGSFVSVATSGGMCTIMVIGTMLKWRTAILVISAIPIVVICLVVLLVPESPVWLLMNNKEHEAKRSFVRLRGNMLVVEAEMSRLKKNLEETTSEKNDNDSCCKMKEIVAAFKDAAFLKPFMILVFLFCLGLPWVGLPFIANYMVGILIEADIPFNPYLVSAGIMLFRFALYVTFSFGIAHRIKRRPLYIFTAIAMIIGNLSIATYFVLKSNISFMQSYPQIKWVPVISILLIYTACAMGYGIVPYMLQGEILPPYARAIGSGLLGFSANVSGFVAIKLGPSISGFIGLDGAFYLYSGIGVLILIVAYYTIPETFRLSLEDIAKIYQCNDNTRRSRDFRRRSSASIVSFYEIPPPYNH